MGICAGLFATLLLIPLYAAANPFSEAPAAATASIPASPAQTTSAAPIQIVKMNDEEPEYQPNSIQISVGQTVEWENDGQVSHSVADDPARANNPADALLPVGVKPFNSGNVMPGGSFRHTFTKPGRYRYFCLTHEMDGMVGEVIVNPLPETPPARVARSSQGVIQAAASTVATGPPIQIVKMNDDDPMYQPNSIRISAGQTVEWENDGQVSHSVTDDPARANNPADALLPAGVKPFNSRSVMPGGRFRHTFTEPGRYRYFCLTHEADKMVGEVIVTPATMQPPEQQLASSKRRIPFPEPNAPKPLKVVRMHDDEPIYQPSSIRIVSGQTVEWKNEGHVSHSVSDDPAEAWNRVDPLRPPGAQPFSSGSILPGGRYLHTFIEPGLYRYFGPTEEGERTVGEVIVVPASSGPAAQSGTGGDGLSAAARSDVAE
jgi:plastocyanin